MQLRPANAERVQVYLVGGVHPDARGQGIGRILLGWQIARGCAHLALSEERLAAWLRLDADERNPGALALAERAGMRPARWFTSMERVVLGSAGATATPLPTRLPPPGTRLVGYSADRAEDARLARNDSFRDHWGSTEFTPERWEQVVAGECSGRICRSSSSRRRAGGCSASRSPRSTRRTGKLQGFASSYLGILGVVRDARGRGLAPALLTAVLRATQEAGLERVVLDVDTESPTGALGLYESVGFVPTSRSIDLVLDVVWSADLAQGGSVSAEPPGLRYCCRSGRPALSGRPRRGGCVLPGRGVAG
ncbi:GNAT family N-acetyltransferase [Salana multivorans]